ncbi:MAG: serine/threonine protein phosphatase, partial [Gammaproteobacteria bacterium]|nr:serine/threonine protein phosphatase [Gammaproteobacteria bacterium]
NSMHVVQEKSASNILQSLDLVIRDDYHKLLSDKISMTLLKKEQLNNAGHLIESVFHGFFASQQKGLLHEKAVSNALEWLSSAPFKLDYYIISNDYQVMQSSNPHISNENYKALTDIKQRNISEIMSNSNLSKRGDFASFIIEGENRTGRSVLAYFLPFPQWGLTIVTSIDISDI